MGKIIRGNRHFQTTQKEKTAKNSAAAGSLERTWEWKTRFSYMSVCLSLSPSLSQNTKKDQKHRSISRTIEANRLLDQVGNHAWVASALAARHKGRRIPIITFTEANCIISPTIQDFKKISLNSLLKSLIEDPKKTQSNLQKSIEDLKMIQVKFQKIWIPSRSSSYHRSKPQKQKQPLSRPNNGKKFLTLNLPPLERPAIYGTNILQSKSHLQPNHNTEITQRSCSPNNWWKLAVTLNIKLFSYDEIKAATRNFHENNKIGRGGFGAVYQGTLKDGTEVAIKTLSAQSRQGVEEFLNEIDTITYVKHPNLLVGPNKNKAMLDWSRRFAICIGTAKGLQFLHEELEPPIVHRDIKASNVLLGEDLTPKIGDFGLAKLFPDNVTHLSTRVAGTVGYLAPEYAMRGQLTKKADVYSFGVLMLEIVSGRSSAKLTWSGVQKFLLELTWELYEEGRLLGLVDPDLGEYPQDEVIRCMKIALFCTQAAAKRRPSMTQVVSMLTRHANLNEKLLTPPGIIHDLMQIYRGTKGTDTSNSPTPPGSEDQSSSINYSTGPPTMSLSGMAPR
ncbi:hypothetical protein ACLOJK_024570 [Asimina triloba]